jgi:exodeoxyribonuclease V beta subunit
VPPPGEEAALLAALRREGYADADLAEGARLLCALIANTLNVRLPEGARLSLLAPDARRAEMEFHFAMGPVSVDALLALLHAHGLVLARQGFGLRRRIEGLMTGKIDLVYVHDGRFHVLDYKSNRLGDYDAAALAEAMRESEYDLQYLIYSLALHRWLRFRLGADYDYDTRFGGVRYLFCRGLDAQRPDAPGAAAPGIHATKPPRDLIDALDALFASDPRSAA